jgi:hypothetical protein
MQNGRRLTLLATTHANIAECKHIKLAFRTHFVNIFLYKMSFSDSNQGLKLSWITGYPMVFILFLVSSGKYQNRALRTVHDYILSNPYLLTTHHHLPISFMLY